MNSIVLAISGRGTLRPLGIHSIPFANNAHDAKYHNNVVVFPFLQWTKVVGS